MARRRKYKKHGENWLKNIDWGVEPQTLKEVFGVILGILGIVLILAIFSSAGQIGITLVKILDQAFGYLGYFIPFVIVILSTLILFPKRFNVRVITYIGLLFFFLFIASLIHPYGGVLGANVKLILINFFGLIGAFIVALGLALVSIILAFNISLNNLREKLFPTPEEKTGVKINGTQHTKVSVFTTVKDKMGLNKVSETIPQATKAPLRAAVTSSPDLSDWELPPLDLLELSNTKATPGNIAKNVEIIQKALKDFSIDVSMGDVNVGPTVTQYTLKPKEGIKLNQITARNNDLSLALAAHPIRIEAPIPGKAAVGVEVPNKVTALVTLKEILESEEFKARKSNLTISLGRDVAGTPSVIDLKKMPHLLIAGATGSGKSICINGIIISFLYQNSPADLRMILIDPKRVEFTRYNGIPHLLCPVITEVDKTVNALRWAVAEMDRRFKLFAQTGKRDIESYNANPDGDKLPYIIIVIDELADLMAQSAREVEAAIVRLAQMARAVGIHLIVATQRPSVDVITGLIKANIISRIAFAVASQIDSRTILDISGAEKLLGNGDMLYVGADLGKPKRVQGVFLSEKEIAKVTDYLKRNGMVQYDESIINYSSSTMGSGYLRGEIDDDLYNDARETVVQAGKASASLLQRRLRVGYARAARLLDLLESEGIIGPAEGAKPRDVLIGPELMARERDYQQEQYQQQFSSPAQSVGQNIDSNQESDIQPPEELTEVDLR